MGDVLSSATQKRLQTGYKGGASSRWRVEAIGVWERSPQPTAIFSNSFGKKSYFVAVESHFKRVKSHLKEPDS